MALRIKTDGLVDVVTPKNKTFTNEEINELIGCDTYELVNALKQGPLTIHHLDRDVTTLYEIGPRTVMIVDENGKLTERPRNTLACKLYLPSRFDPIVGDVLLVLVPEEYN